MWESVQEMCVLPTSFTYEYSYSSRIYSSTYRSQCSPATKKHLVLLSLILQQQQQSTSMVYS